jgi:hypothetical protein
MRFFIESGSVRLVLNVRSRSIAYLKFNKLIEHAFPMKVIEHAFPMKVILHAFSMKVILHAFPMKVIEHAFPMKVIPETRHAH